MKKYYFPLFDILKLFAAMALVLYHCQIFTGTYYEGSINFAFGTFDTQRVTAIFLILSGFFASISVSRWEQEISMSERWKRVGSACLSFLKRFYPFVFLTTIIVFVIITVFHDSHDRWIWNQVFTFKNLAASLLLQSQTGVFSKFGSVNGVTWYLNALLKCLITFYLISFAPKKAKPFLYVTCMILGYVMYFVSGDKLLVPWIGGWSGKAFGAFYIGVLLAPLFVKGKRDYKILIAGILLGIYCILVFAVKLPCDFILLTDGLLFPGILLLMSLCKSNQMKMTRKLGEISFHLYIWHVPLLYIYGLLVYTKILPAFVPAYVRFIILGCGILFSLVSYIVLEKICLKKWLK